MTASREERGSVSNKRVIVVEDDESTRILYAHALTNAGYEVHAVDTIKLALDTVQNTSIDVIITDLGLAGESGLDLLRELDKEQAIIPVIVVTADDRVESVQSALRERAFDYLTIGMSCHHHVLWCTGLVIAGADDEMVACLQQAILAR